MDCVYIARFGESLRIAQDHLDCKNFYAFNPGFDRREAQMTNRQQNRANAMP